MVIGVPELTQHGDDQLLGEGEILAAKPTGWVGSAAATMVNTSRASFNDDLADRTSLSIEG